MGKTLFVSLASHSAGVKLLAYGSRLYVQYSVELFTEQTVDGMSAKRVCVPKLCVDASLNSVELYSIYTSNVELLA